MSLLAPRPSVAALLLTSALAARASAAVPTVAPAEVHPGQHAIVRTVFEGARIDSFECEILGTLDSGRSEGLMILARALSPNAVRTGVAQGMSGSPVTIDGRLVGALSTGFSFTREPIFGITPIGEMLAVLDHPDATRNSDPSAGMNGVEPSERGALPRFHSLRWVGDDADASAPTPAPTPAATGPLGAPTPLALPVACAGLNSAAAPIARELLAGFGLAAVPGGRATDPGPSADALVPGASCAIDLLRGDLLMTAIGTVTWRDGDRVLVFGHPLFQSGDVRLPLATATIATIVPSEQIAFKLGQRGREVGAVLQDRRAAVGGRLGVVAHMLPMRVDVAGVAPAAQRFHFECVEDRTLAPIIVGIAAANSVLESGGTGTGQTLRWTLRLHRRGAPPLELTDVVTGDSPIADLASGIGAPLRFLYGNPFARLDLDSLEIGVVSVPGREAWTLRSARVLESTVRPRGRVHVACELEAWRGGVTQHTFELTVPAEAPDGRYVLWVGGGSELARLEASRLPGRYRATSLDDAWRRLAASRGADTLYAALLARAPEVSADGRDYPELPAFALSLLANDQTASTRARPGDLAWLDERRVPVQGMVRGDLQLTVTVETRGTLAQP